MLIQLSIHVYLDNSVVSNRFESKKEPMEVEYCSEPTTI